MNRIWMNGQIDEKEFPFVLLSNNVGYYGDVHQTAFKCVYADCGDADRVKKILTDGNFKAKNRVFADRKAELIFDIGEVCRVGEIDVVGAPGAEVAVSLSLHEGEFTEPHCGALALHDADKPALLRIALDAEARFVKIVCTGEKLDLAQIYVWGHASVETEEKSFAYQTFSIANSVALESIEGIDRTAFRDEEAYFFRKEFEKNGLGDRKAVFSVPDKWGELTYAPILPHVNDVNKEVALRTVRNGVEYVCLAVTSLNPYGEEKVTVTRQDDFVSGISAKVYAFGAIPSRWYGVNSGPMFDGENGIGKELAAKYLTNASAIADFPTLRLPPCGSVLLWVRITADNVKAGNYTLVLRAGGSETKIKIEVLDLMLPDDPLRICAYSAVTEMYPFRYTDRYERELAYQKQLGINCFFGFPEKGTYLETVRKIYEHPVFSIWISGEEGHDLYAGVYKTAEDISGPVAEKFEKHARDVLRRAEQLGLDYDEWEAQSADEPGKKNMGAFAESMRIVKRVDPKINVYANPSFWIGWEKGGALNDEEEYDCLKDWYAQVVDSSSPHALNLTDRPLSMKLYTSPRRFNSFYDIIAQHSKSERRSIVGSFRELAWKALDHGFNGWSIYAYFRPNGDAWDDFDARDDGYYEDLPDYELVYPGKLGPIPTRASEAFGAGYGDYRLMTLLKSVDLEAFNDIVDEYRGGNKDFEALKNKALDALEKFTN